MVFSSIPVYIDAPNWQQQPVQHVGENYRIENPYLLRRPLPPEHRHVSGGTTGLCKPGSMADRARQANMPQPEAGLNCPRCESTNTKFCYFNNYSLSQPRHFCKTCRRYWTRGGALRNVQVGGGRRNKKNKRSRSKSPAAMDRQAISNHDGQNIVSRSYATSDLTMSHQLPQPSQLHLMTSLRNINSRYGVGNLGLNLGAHIAAHSDPSGFHMGNTSSTVDQQWRFPFLTSTTFDSLTSIGTCTFQSHQSVETPAALALIGDSESPLGSLTSSSTVTTATRAMTQFPSVNYEDTQALNLATSSTPSLTTNGNQYWGGGNPWTDISALNYSSTSHLL